MIQKMKLVGAVETAASYNPSSSDIASAAIESVSYLVKDSVRKHLGKPTFELKKSGNVLIGNVIFPFKAGHASWAGVPLDQIGKIVKEFDKFCSMEKTAVIDGRKWTIGDGDDWLAVQFSSKGIHVWIRYFGE